mgnify:CR=1 FL=1
MPIAGILGSLMGNVGYYARMGKGRYGYSSTYIR